MIKSIADLLEALRYKELQLLQKWGYVTHPSVIGDMHEAITRSLLERTLFEGLDLRVAEGFVRRGKEELSRQMDCMIVVGEGERIASTDHFIFNPDAVVAIVEVKKTLYGTDLEDAYVNLLSVPYVPEGDAGYLSRVRIAYRAILREDAPSRGEFESLPYEKQMILYSLMRDAATAPRIVFGHYGYTSEYTLRSGFMRYLEQRMAGGYASGLGPHSMPNLILCANSALIRLNGMPIGHPLLNEGWWPIMGSSSGRSALLLLEVVWTRLASMFRLSPDIFGDDLELEPVNLLLIGRPERQDGKGGWHYDYIRGKPKDLELSQPDQSWQPAILDEAQAEIISILCHEGSLAIDTDPRFRAHLAEVGMTADKLCNELAATDLVYVDAGRRLKLLTDGCAVVILPDGRIVAGENSSGRLARWVAQEERSIRGRDKE